MARSLSSGPLASISQTESNQTWTWGSSHLIRGAGIQPFHHQCNFWCTNIIFFNPSIIVPELCIFTSLCRFVDIFVCILESKPSFRVSPFKVVVIHWPQCRPPAPPRITAWGRKTNPGQTVAGADTPPPKALRCQKSRWVTPDQILQE